MRWNLNPASNPVIAQALATRGSGFARMRDAMLNLATLDAGIKHAAVELIAQAE